jgi:hypothetical protein
MGAELHNNEWTPVTKYTPTLPLAKVEVSKAGKWPRYALYSISTSLFVTMPDETMFVDLTVTRQLNRHLDHGEVSAPFDASSVSRHAADAQGLLPTDAHFSLGSGPISRVNVPPAWRSLALIHH